MAPSRFLIQRAVGVVSQSERARKGLTGIIKADRRRYGSNPCSYEKKYRLFNVKRNHPGGVVDWFVEQHVT